MTKKHITFIIISAISAILLAAFLLSLRRIETGEVGVRIGFDKQIVPGELQPGSFNQTLIGSVMTFPVRDVTVVVDNMNPLTADNTSVKDFDLTVVYGIEPSQVAELYGSKNKSFHAIEKDGDILLMANFVAMTARNAAYKVVRKYEALNLADSREKMEQEIRAEIVQTLNDEKLTASVQISQALIRNIVLADEIVKSANELVMAKNQLKQKEIEVKTAEAEARRMAALANQSAQSIEYMRAQASLAIAEGIKAGKVNAVVVPFDFRGMVNITAGGSK